MNEDTVKQVLTIAYAIVIAVIAITVMLFFFTNSLLAIAILASAWLLRDAVGYIDRISKKFAITKEDVRVLKLTVETHANRQTQASFHARQQSDL